MKVLEFFVTFFYIKRIIRSSTGVTDILRNSYDKRGLRRETRCSNKSRERDAYLPDACRWFEHVELKQIYKASVSWQVGKGR